MDQFKELRAHPKMTKALLEQIERSAKAEPHDRRNFHYARHHPGIRTTRIRETER